MPGQREQAIRERAYAIWKEEGRPDGKALDHWLRAEAEIISATEQQASPLEKATAFYEKNYALLNNWFLTPEIKIVLGRTVDQTCRFCGKSSPEVTFKMDAHAIPESLGNKSLFSAYECDTCNKLFGETIENDFGNWSKPLRTFARIRGKKGVPTLAKAGSMGWRIQFDDSRFTIKQYEDDPIFTADEEAKIVTFQLQRDVYTPVAVLKAFVKMGLSVMPDEEMPNFAAALNWIRRPDHQVSLVSESEFPILYSFVPGPMPNDKIAIATFRRKEGIEDVPYAFFILGYGNEVFQIFLPAPMRDHMIDGKQITITAFPNPRDIYPSQFGPTRRGVMNLTGRNAVRGEIFTLRIGFDRVA
ncbi:MAG TPA: DUF2934 domain-containing protein [Stellaceae bacterium]|nr:DUF2934 domain-containing protein [Stellaceae bacterium]